MSITTLDPIYTRRKDTLHIALYSPRTRSIIAQGSFPASCPRHAIGEWIRSKVRILR